MAMKTDEKSIAVLPFEDLSRADRSQQAFCEGMAAEIINALAAISGLRVIYAHVGSALPGERPRHQRDRRASEGADGARRSHVRRGRRAAFASRRSWFDTADGSQMWATRFDRGSGDIFDIQDEIAAAIVGQPQGPARGQRRAPRVKRVTDSIEAHNAVSEGTLLLGAA